MGMGVVSVCLTTYKPLFSRIIRKIKAKFSSHGSREDPIRHPPAAVLVEMLGTLDTANTETESPAPTLGSQRERWIPSQSSESAHIGLLGSSLDLEEGRREGAAVAMKQD